MQQKDTKLPADPDTPPPTTLGMASIGQNSTFCLSEHGHFAYQAYENHECSNMVPNILPADAPPPWDGVNKSKFMFYITGSCCISN